MATTSRPSKFEDPYFLPDSATLEALGTVAIAAAGVEEMLHALFWKIIEVPDEQGSIVTRDMKPGRMADDILKLAKASNFSDEKIRDLQGIFQLHKDLTTRRNQYLHWIWMESNKGTHRVRSPSYRDDAEYVFSTKDLNELAADLAWLQTRLDSYCMTEAELLAKRKQLKEDRDLYAPAPWLLRRPR